MSNRIEKIQWVIISVFVVIFMGMFVFPGLPAALPEVLGPQLNYSGQEFSKRLNPEKRKEHTTNLRQASIQAKKTNPQNRIIQQDFQAVDENVFTMLKDEREAIDQIHKVKTIIHTRNNTIELNRIDPSSYWPRLGFEDGDVIESLDGRPLPVNDTSAARQLYKEKIEQLEAGGSIVVTVRRNGQSLLKSFSVQDFTK